MTKWSAITEQFTERSTRWIPENEGTARSCLTDVHTRSWRGVAVRGHERVRCPHAHRKRGVAQRCAEKLTRAQESGQD